MVVLLIPLVNVAQSAAEEHFTRTRTSCGVKSTFRHFYYYFTILFREGLFRSAPYFEYWMFSVLIIVESVASYIKSSKTDYLALTFQ